MPLQELRGLADELLRDYGSQNAAALLIIERIARHRPDYDPLSVPWTSIDEWTIDAERYREYLSLTTRRRRHARVEIGAGTIVRPARPADRAEPGIRPDNDEDAVRERLQRWQDAVRRSDWEQAWEVFHSAADRVGNLLDFLEAAGIETEFGAALGRFMGPLGLGLTAIDVGVSIYRGMNADLASAQLMGWAYGAAYAAVGVAGPGAADAPSSGFGFHSIEENRQAFAAGVREGRGLPTAGLGRLGAMIVAHGRVAVLNGLWQRALDSYPEYASPLRQQHLQWAPPGVDRLN
jgi:hypothetical protein